MLEIAGARIRYGPVLAVEDLCLAVPPKSVVALLGRNGAGKSSTLNAVAGLVKLAKGTIKWEGRTISGWPPERVVRAGIALVPENRELFQEMTTLENLELGAFSRKGRLHHPDDVERVFTYFPQLRAMAKRPAGALSGGQQQFLAIGRALMARPRLLLLDEPSLGLAPLVVREIFSILSALARDEGVSVLLVEQNARAALQLASQAYLLDAGRVVFSGESANLSIEEVAQLSYLGGKGGTQP